MEMRKPSSSCPFGVGVEAGSPGFAPPGVEQVCRFPSRQFGVVGGVFGRGSHPRSLGG